MNVAIFSPFVLGAPHFGGDLELAQCHLDAGDRVTIATCDTELPSCDLNLAHREHRCADCIEIRRRGLQLLGGPYRVTRLFDYFREEFAATVPAFASVAELQAFRVGTFDAGMAAASTLIYHLRDADFDTMEHARLVANTVRAAWMVYAATSAFLEATPVDRFYVVNSRFATTRGIMRACQERGIECLVHDRGMDIHHYSLFPNTFPHDIAWTDQEIMASWNSADPATREQVASEWYVNKSKGIEATWLSFVAAQEEDRLPDDWNPDRRNVVVFTSSEDEFGSIGDGWRNPLYASEVDGIRQILRSLDSTGDDVHLTVRVHPNLAGVDNGQTRGLRGLAAPFLTVVGPESAVSTYALVRHASAVLTFGSTVGIEAVYWGVPSILAGMSHYRNLGGTYNPSTHQELMQLLSAPLYPMPKEAALQYAHYYATYGVRYLHYAANGILSGRFRGTDIWEGRGIRPV